MGSADRLEALSAAAWPAETIETIEGWRLGFTGGVTRRANSVQSLEWTGKALGTAIDEAERRYHARDLPPCFKISPASQPPELAHALAERGYRAEGEADVLIAEAPTSNNPLPAGLAVRLLDTPEPRWIEAAWPASERGGDIPVLLALVGRIVPPSVFVTAELDDAPAGAALAVAEGAWAGITGVNTLPAFRRRGVARAMMDGFGAWARERGAGSIYLQVERGNAPARALYEGLGYQSAYSYHYLVAPGRAAGA